MTKITVPTRLVAHFGRTLVGCRVPSEIVRLRSGTELTGNRWDDTGEEVVP